MLHFVAIWAKGSNSNFTLCTDNWKLTHSNFTIKINRKAVIYSFQLWRVHTQCKAVKFQVPDSLNCQIRACIVFKHSLLSSKSTCFT